MIIKKILRGGDPLEGLQALTSPTVRDGCIYLLDVQSTPVQQTNYTTSTSKGTLGSVTDHLK